MAPRKRSPTGPTLFPSQSVVILEAALEATKSLATQTSVSHEDFRAWSSNVQANLIDALGPEAPQTLEFNHLLAGALPLGIMVAGPTDYTKVNAQAVKSAVPLLTATVDNLRLRSSATQSTSNSHLQPGAGTSEVMRQERSMQPDPKKVFIIHGRNTAARIAVEHFLKALKLEPLDFDELAADMGAEFIGNIVLEGIRRARGIVALFTPDEFAALLPALRGTRDTETEIKRWQSRPNVIFEAGIAFGMARERSVIVTLGTEGTEVSLLSDLAGIHVVRLDNNVASRRKFRQKLIGMGCELDQRSDAWTEAATSGDFEACMASSLGVSTRDPFP